ncbi:MAG TPA: DUF6152 family protein [Caulobacteraceae bacterium]|jgi:hypothetical protein|nr:DUF6152 family protein [Caulobacteraceae bacterium]
MKARFLAALAAALVLPAGAALAHHSAAMFDRAKTVTLEGTVKSFAYTMPHSWVDMVVVPAGGGAPQEWGIECGTPPAMRGQGLTPSVLKAGDKIIARIHPLKDGRTQGSFIDITVNGRVYGNGRPVTGEPVG